MSRWEQHSEHLVSASVAAIIALLWLIIMAVNEPPKFNHQYVQLAIAWLLFTVPWAVAARLLWRDWWSHHGAHVLRMDGPARLLAVAVATLPEDRREWGAAMEAELHQVQGPSGRWRFAAGCAWTAVFPPQAGPTPVLIAALPALACLMVIGPAVDATLPGMRVFAVTFVALAGGLISLAAARSPRLTQWVEHPLLAIVGIVGVARCVSLTVGFLAQYPDGAEYLSWGYAVTLAVVLAVSLCFSLAAPRSLTENRVALGFGFAGAAIFGLGFLITSRLTISTQVGPLIWVLLAPWCLYFIISAAAAAVGRSFRTGVQAALWGALAGAVLVFMISIPETMYRYAIDGRTLIDGELGYPIGVNLPDAIWIVVVIPLLGLPFGVIGAAAGLRLRDMVPARALIPGMR